MGSQGSAVASKVTGSSREARAREDVPEEVGVIHFLSPFRVLGEKIESICSSQNKKRKIIMILKKSQAYVYEA